MDMTDSQKKETINLLMTVLMALMTTENLKALVGTLLDFVEKTVDKTDNKWDDQIIDPIVKRVKDAFGIAQ